MEKEHLKSAALLAAGVLLLGSFGYNASISHRLRDTQQQLADLDRSVRTSMENLEYQVRSQMDSLRDQMEQGQSILDQSSAELDVEDGKIYLTLSASPKEQRVGERLYARVTTGDGTVYEKAADETGSAEFELEMTGSVQPGFAIKSLTGMRQESLEPMDLGEKLSTLVFSQWQDDTLLVHVDELTKLLKMNSLDDVENAVIWVEPGRDEGAAPYDTSYLGTFLRELEQNAAAVPAVAQLDENGSLVGFSADLSRIMEQNKGQSCLLHLSAEISGIPFVAQRIGYFRMGGSTGEISEISAGDTVLEPVFE